MDRFLESKPGHAQPSAMAIQVRLLLTVLSVLCCYLSLPGGPLPILAVVGLAPLGVAIHGATRAQALALAYGFGFLGWIACTGGLVLGLSSYVHLSFQEAFLFIAVLCAYLAIPYGLFGCCYGIFQWMKLPWGHIKTAACLAVLLSLFPTPLPMSPAHALSEFPAIIQILDLGGEPLLLFSLCLFNWQIVELVLRIARQEPLMRGLSSLLVIITAMVVYGQVRIEGYHSQEAASDAARMISVVALQPNILLPISGEASSQEADSAAQDLLEMSEQSLVRHPRADLVVWPEIPADIDCTAGTAVRERISTVAARLQTAFLVNCVLRSSDGGKYNTALFVPPAGEPSRYIKRMLFPFAEYLPGEGRIKLLRTLFPGASRYEPGTESVVFRIRKELSVMIAICYEILFSGHVETLIEKGGNVLINQTNDAWFGNSRIVDFLVSASIFKAVEFRVPVIRVSNSGNCLVVMASGEIKQHSRTTPFTRTTRVFRVFIPDQHRTPVSGGARFIWLLAAAWGIDAWRSIVRKEGGK